MVEFVGDFDFLREGEGAKRESMMLIWKVFCNGMIFKLIVEGRVLRVG
ncbi:TPA: hypothetical protein ACW7QF_000909 [Klebsiella aerogenes]|nr:hypothetical protein [Klebsiella aerogenes]MDQ8596608.1 hypothetical protein [Klebsiella aerogenes]